MARKITVVGLGGSDASHMPLGVYRRLTSASALYLRTKEHPVVAELGAELPGYVSFDSVYEENSQFGDVYKKLKKSSIKKQMTGTLFMLFPDIPLLQSKPFSIFCKTEEKGAMRLRLQEDKASWIRHLQHSESIRLTAFRWWTA